MIDINNFDAIEISLASSKADSAAGAPARSPSRRTIKLTARLKPEKDGLFCERIFGSDQGLGVLTAASNKRVRYKGIVCERCGCRGDALEGSARAQWGHVRTWQRR